MIKIEQLLEESRYWRSRLKGLDSGSYCEEPCQQYSILIKIVKAYEDIIDNMLKYERYGYKL